VSNEVRPPVDGLQTSIYSSIAPARAESASRVRETDGPGSGFLQFSRSGKATVLRRRFAMNPLKLLNPRNHGCGAWVYSSTYGGGLVGGDAIDIRAQVDVGATGFLSSQSSTKIYRSLANASQTLRVSIAAGGLMVVAPDPIVCFKDSHFEQEQEFTLAADANLILVDCLCAGRTANGERWAFRNYESKITVTQDGVTLLYDALRLNPEQGGIESRMGRFNAFATIVLIGPRIESAGTKLQAAIAAMPVVRGANLICACSPFRNSGTLLRILGVSVEEVSRKIQSCLSFVPDLLGDDPWSRKR
jgi:urease accessory protein